MKNKKTAPVYYKMLRYILTGKTEGLDIKTILQYTPQDQILKRIQHFYDFLDKEDLIVAISESEKDFWLADRKPFRDVGYDIDNPKFNEKFIIVIKNNRTEEEHQTRCTVTAEIAGEAPVGSANLSS